ncbi:MAG TPA: hydrolase, partial [Afipia sp.]
HVRFGLPAVLPTNIEKQIKAADMGAAYLEATHLAGFGEAEAKRLFGRDPKLPSAIQQDYVTPWSATKAERTFLARFKSLLD